MFTKIILIAVVEAVVFVVAQKVVGIVFEKVFAK
jgi:uncharacterized membrane protein